MAYPTKLSEWTKDQLNSVRQPNTDKDKNVGTNKFRKPKGIDPLYPSPLPRGARPKGHDLAGLEWNFEEGYATKNPKAKKSGGKKRGPKAKKSSVQTVKKVSKTDNMVAVLQGLGVYEDIISAAFAKSVAVHQPKPTGKKRGPKAKAKKATTTTADKTKVVDKNKS